MSALPAFWFETWVVFGSVRADTAEVTSVEFEVIVALFCALIVIAPAARAAPAVIGCTWFRNAVAARLTRFDAATPPTATAVPLPLAVLVACETLVTIAFIVSLAMAWTSRAPATDKVELVMLAVTLDADGPGLVTSSGALSVQKLSDPRIVPSVASANPVAPSRMVQPIALRAMVPEALIEVDVLLATELVSARDVTVEESPART